MRVYTFIRHGLGSIIDTSHEKGLLGVARATVQIGPYTLRNNLVLAPMAGVTDRPFRQLCKELGAGMAVSEMVSSNALLWGSKKTRCRLDHQGEGEPRAVQIAGAEPRMIAEAARYNAANGAQIIDINMGCPAKKVCSKNAGSALLRDEKLVGRILDAVVAAVNVPVTLKIRTGWDKEHRNAVHIARLAQEAGVQALAIHGRTRACGFSGEAEYDSVAAAKAEVRMPVIANGDIRPRIGQYLLGLLRGTDVAVGNDGHSSLCLSGSNGVILRFSAKATGPGSPVYRQCLNTGLLC